MLGGALDPDRFLGLLNPLGGPFDPLHGSHRLVMVVLLDEVSELPSGQPEPLRVILVLLVILLEVSTIVSRLTLGCFAPMALIQYLVLLDMLQIDLMSPPRMHFLFAFIIDVALPILVEVEEGIHIRLLVEDGVLGLELLRRLVAIAVDHVRDELYRALRSRFLVLSVLQKFKHSIKLCHQR